MRNLTKPLLFALAFLLAGCGNKPQITALAPNATVLAFGDSLTAGTGVSENMSYPAVLANLLDCEVINEGKPGEQTQAGVRRLKSALARHKPDLVILCHGGNDFLNKLIESETRKNVERMISMCKDAGADVILIGVPRPGIILKTPEFYGELAETHDIPYDGKIMAKTLQNPELKSDHIHPNKKGYALLAATFSKLIKSSSSSD